MRLGEPETVVKTLKEKPLSLPVISVSAAARFLKNMKGIKDAEDKRKVFRDTFYSTLSEAARKRNVKSSYREPYYRILLRRPRGSRLSTTSWNR